MRVLLAILALLLTLTANAASTYYISASGSDAANGLTKPTAWAHHPYMAGFTGTYVHAAGDTFVFKGGDTWGNSCFVWHIMAGGTPGNVDTYTTDATWYTGASYSRPIFDAGGIELSGGYDVMVLLNQGAAPHDITFNGFDFRRLYWTGNKPYSWVAFFNLQTSARITINNCYFHNWTHGTFANGTSDSLKVVIGANSSPWNVGCVLSNCTLDGENTANATLGTSSGEATYAYSGTVTNCIVRNMASGFIVTGDPVSVTPQVVAACDIGPLYTSFDPGAHPDGIFMNGGNLFYWHNNYLHDCHTLSIFAGEGSGNEDTYIFNNVIWNCSAAPVTVDNFYSGARVYVWNNTLVGDSFSGVRVAYRGNGPLGTLDLRNNLFVSNGSQLSLDTGATVTHYTNQNNILLSTGQAFVLGYTAIARYAPTSDHAPTVGAGQSMAGLLGGLLDTDIAAVARPQSLGWDIGAYQYPIGASGPGVVALSISAQSVSQNASNAVVTVVRSGGSDGAASVIASTADGTAVAGHDYTATTALLSWNDGTVGARNFSVPFLPSGDTAITNRTFTVTLSSPVTVALAAPSNQTVTILMNRPNTNILSTNGGVLWLSASRYFTTETNGTVTITVNRMAGTNAPVGVSYATADGNAAAGTDYTATSGTLSWTANDNAAKTFTVPIINSASTGPSRFFYVRLANPTGGATLGLSEALVSIAMTNTLSSLDGFKLIGKLTISGSMQLVGGLGTNVAPITLIFDRITAEGDLRTTAEGDTRVTAP